MSLSAYRLIQPQHVSTAFDGEGTRFYGGRWNSPGTRMVYVASTRSLATLEVLVHTEDLPALEGRYRVIPVTFPDKIVLRAKIDELPSGWFSPEPIADTQIFGDSWIRGMRSAVMEVPSAVIHEEWNYLINPMHPDFTEIVIGEASPFR